MSNGDHPDHNQTPACNYWSSSPIKGMTNDELSAAIKYAFESSRGNAIGTRDSAQMVMLEHLRKLVEIQASRAVIIGV